MEKKEYLSPTIQIVEMESCCILTIQVSMVQEL